MRRKALQVGMLFGQGMCVMLVALFAAVGVNAMLSSRIVRALPPFGTQPPPEPALSPTPSTLPQAANHLLFGRDLFNRDASVDAPGELGAPSALQASPDAQALQTAQGIEAVRTDLPLTLLGTMVASDPRFSRAQLRLLQTGEDLTARVGDQLLSAVIVGIGRTYVAMRRLDRSGEIEILELHAGTPGSARRVIAATPSSPPLVEDASVTGQISSAPSQVATPSDAPAVRAVGEGQWTIRRDVAAEQARSRQQLAVETQVGAYIANGEMVGYRFNNITEGSVLSQLGLSSGDVILSINGQRPGSEEGSLQFLDLVQNGEVVIELDRRGEKRQVQFRPE